jgi:hypothetical protein
MSLPLQGDGEMEAVLARRWFRISREPFMALRATQKGMKMFVVPTLVGLFKNPPKGGTTNRFSLEKGHG